MFSDEKKFGFKVLVLAVVVLFGTVGANAMTSEPVETEHELTLMSTTDLHQYVMPYDYMADEPADDVGFAKVFTKIEEVREDSENTLLFDTGDMIQGSLVGNYEALVEPLEPGETQAIVEALNYAEYDAAAVGNHEVQDFGLDFFDRAVEGAEFPWVSANMRQYENRDETYPGVEPYVILEEEIDGEDIKIGVISFVNPQIMEWGRDWLQGEVYAEDAVPVAEEYIPELEEKTDIVILNAHMGLDDSDVDSYEARENAVYHLAQIDGIDAIHMGHQHNHFPGNYDDMEGVDNEEGTIHGVPAVMPGSWGDSLGIIELDLVHENGEWEVADSVSRLKGIDEETEANSEIKEIAEDVHEDTIEYVRTPLGETEIDLTSYFSRIKDTALIQIVNEAQIEYAENQFEGSEYEDLPTLSAAAPFIAGREGPEYFSEVTGDITIGDVTDIYIYDNTIRVLKLTGEEVVDWLEKSAELNFNQIDPDYSGTQELVNTDEPAFNYDVIEGVDYEIDVTQPEGERVVNVEYNGEDLDYNQEFLVVTNDYRAGGGGGFPHMEEENVVFETADVNRNKIMSYVEDRGTVNPEATNNWNIKPVETAGDLIYQSHPEAGDYIENYGIEGINFLEKDDEGWGVYEIDLMELQ